MQGLTGGFLALVGCLAMLEAVLGMGHTRGAVSWRLAGQMGIGAFLAVVGGHLLEVW